MKIRVLLVEDQKIMQKYFASMVQGDERFLLVDVLNDGEKAVSYCNHTVVDLVLMDVQTFQNHDGLLAAETIKKQHPAVKIIVITSLVDPEILTRAKEKGADGEVSQFQALATALASTIGTDNIIKLREHPFI